jgi:hypothetical protein
VNADWLSVLHFRDHAACHADVTEFTSHLLFHIRAHEDSEYCDQHHDDPLATDSFAFDNAVHIANSLSTHLLIYTLRSFSNGTRILTMTGIPPIPSNTMLGQSTWVNDLSRKIVFSTSFAEGLDDGCWSDKRQEVTSELDCRSHSPSNAMRFLLES